MVIESTKYPPKNVIIIDFSPQVSQDELNGLKGEVQESQDQLKQAVFDLRKSQEQNKLYQDMAQELEDKVNMAEGKVGSSRECVGSCRGMCDLFSGGCIELKEKRKGKLASTYLSSMLIFF